MSEFSRLDRLVREAEEAELKRMGAQEDMMENYFEQKRRKELSKKNINSMDWSEIHELNELKKSKTNDQYADSNVSDPKPEEQRAEAIGLIQQILSHPNCNAEIKNDISNISNLLSKLNLDDNTESQHTKEPEEIADEEEVSVSKGLQIRKSSGATLVSGWSTIEEIDYGGDILHVDDFKKNLQEFYLKNGKVCLQHDVNNVIGKLRSYQIKKNKDSKFGIHVVVELFDAAVEKNIKAGNLKGFSWSFSANREKTCEKDRCFQNLKTIPHSIKELSIVDHPCNADALIEAVHHSS